MTGLFIDISDYREPSIDEVLEREFGPLAVAEEYDYHPSKMNKE